MLVSDVITRVRNSAGDTSVLQFTDSQVIDWINDGIKECVVLNRLCQKTANQNMVIGTDTYPLPTDIFKLHSVIVDSEKIRVSTLQEWEEANSGYGAAIPVGNGRPGMAYVWAGNMVFTPPPDRTYSLKVNYIYEPAALTLLASDITTVLPPEYHLRIVTYCLSQIALQDDDLAKYQMFYQMFTSGVVDLKADNVTQEDVYPSISVASRDMGDDGYASLYYG